jgi:transposase InsO family protein
MDHSPLGVDGGLSLTKTDLYDEIYEKDLKQASVIMASFPYHAAMRDELLNGEIFYTLREVQVLLERWRVHYNTIRPHSALGYRTPAPEIIVPGGETQAVQSCVN